MIYLFLYIEVSDCECKNIFGVQCTHEIILIILLRQSLKLNTRKKKNIYIYISHFLDRMDLFGQLKKSYLHH